MTTIVRWSEGIPFEKSRRGSARGGTSTFISKFTTATAICDAAMIPSSADSQNRQSSIPKGRITPSSSVAAAVSSSTGPRYQTSGERRAVRPTIPRRDQGTRTRLSSCGRPLSMR